MKQTAVTIQRKSNIRAMWRDIISHVHADDGKVTFLISDIDGTLEETDEKLCQEVEGLKNSGESIFFMIATGRSHIERVSSTKIKGDCLAKHSPIMICQGGGVVSVDFSTEKHDYLIPFETDVNKMVDTIAKALKVTRQQLFRNENLCIHYYVLEEGREVIGIPIAKVDEPKVKKLLAKHGNNLMAAFDSGSMEDYTTAIREYLERGMPKEAIGVLYESELSEKVITEITIVGPDLSSCKGFLEENSIICRVQQQIADRYPGSRGAKEGVRPDIADIVTIGKKDHVDAIIDVVREMGGMTIGFGDQGNDDFLYSTDYSFVAMAAPIGKNGGWGFAMEMAEKAEEYFKTSGPKVIHARHGSDGKLLNWAVKSVIEAKGFEKRKQLCEKMSTSTLNLSLRRWLKTRNQPRNIKRL